LEKEINMQTKMNFLYLAPTIVGLALVAVRNVMLIFVWNINNKAFMSQIKKLVRAKNVDMAIKLSNSAPGALLPRTIKLMLQEYQNGTRDRSSLEESSHFKEHYEVVLNKFRIFNLLALIGIGISTFIFVEHVKHFTTQFFIIQGICLFIIVENEYRTIMMRKKARIELDKMLEMLDDFTEHGFSEKQEKPSSSSDKLICSKCGRENGKHYKYCLSCGEDLDI
jgi:hypothetical protein